MRVETDKGWTEVVIDEDCGFDKFYAAADILSESFNILFTKKLDDFDTLYWDFDYENLQLTLNYNIYSGISLHPTALTNAIAAANSAVLRLGNSLFSEVASLDWFDYNGDDKSTTGTEGGTIILDIEHSAGARITLEKDCGTIPFAVTLGIYSLMMHTQFENSYEDAINYVTNAKFLINKIIEMYDIKSEDRTDHWYQKQARLIDELARIER